MYKVKCKLVNFEADVQNFPCHFGYAIGDEIYYDGVNFTGKICPHLIVQMMPVVYYVHLLGYNSSRSVPFRYRGPDVRDPSMAKYDGVGWRPMKTGPETAPEKKESISQPPKTAKVGGAHFLCGDSRTLAHFTCEPVDLSDSEYCQPFYRRAVSLLEKIEREPGIETKAIISRFSDFQRDEISPPLTPAFIDVLLAALADMDYIVVEEGKARATGRQPPSRPKIG